MKNIYLIFSLILLILVSACKKDKDDPITSSNPPNPVSQLLQSHAWKFNETFLLEQNGGLYPYNLPGCLLDDKLEYRGNNLYLKDAGSVLCPGQNQRDTLGWTLVNNNTGIRVDNKGTITNKDILTLNSDTLITKEVSPQGDTMLYIYLKY